MHGGGPLQTSNEGHAKGRPEASSGSSLHSAGRPGATHRSASARPIAAGVWICAAGSLVWLLIAGEQGAALRAAPWLALLSWFVYASQWRPCLRVNGTGFEVINGLRDHRIPFGAVKDVEVRYTTAIWVGDKKYVSWGAPTPPSALSSGFQHGANLGSSFTALPVNERISNHPETRSGRDAIAAAWRARFDGLTSTHEIVVSRWNTPVVVVGLLAVGAVVATALM